MQTKQLKRSMLQNTAAHQEIPGSAWRSRLPSRNHTYAHISSAANDTEEQELKVEGDERGTETERT